MIKHLRLWGLYLYISTTRLRPRQNREIGKEATERKRLKNQLIRERGQKCEICGFVGGVQLHHVLPYSKFPQLAGNPDNVKLVCMKCHNEIHNNPFIHAKMIRKKCKELGIDYKMIYG